MAEATTNMFGALLRVHRKQALLSQEALAQCSTVSARSISDLERGVSRMPHRDTVVLLAQALGLSGRSLSEFFAAAREQMASESQPSLNLPPIAQPLNPLIGRERERDDLSNLLTREDVHLVTITGSPGVGKTRLAVQMLETLKSRFNGYVAFISLAPLRDDSRLLPAIGEALSISCGRGQSWAQALSEGLAVAPVLLALDNFEQILHAATTLATWLQTCPGVTALVTSRAPLRIRGEYIYPLGPLSCPDDRSAPGSGSGDELFRYDAVRLFIQRAQAVRPGWTPSESEWRGIGEICAHTSGMALAIELVAARTRALSIEQLRSRITESGLLPLATQGARDLPTRHRTMRSALLWSCEQLDQRQRKVFQRLGICVGGFTEQLAAALCRDLHFTPADLLYALEILCDHQLIRVQSAEGDTRYAMLEVIREFAQDELSAAGDMRAAQGHLASYIVELAEQAKRWLETDERARWLGVLDAEYEHVRVALRWLDSAMMIRAGLQLCGALQRYWYIRELLQEGSDWSERFLSHVQDDGTIAPDALAGALYTAGSLAYLQSRLAQARERLESCLAIYRESGDGVGQALALNVLGLTLTDLQVATAGACFEESIALWRARGDADHMSAPMNNLARLLRNQGRYAEAIALFQQCLAVHQATQKAELIANALNNIGDSYNLLGEPGRAEEFALQALARFQSMQSKIGVANALALLAAVARTRGDLTRAQALTEEALAIRKELNLRADMASSLNELGEILADVNELDQAGVCFNEAARLAHETGMEVFLANSVQGLALIASRSGDSERAATLLGGIARYRDAIDHMSPPANREAAARLLREAREALESSIFEMRYEEGARTPLSVLAGIHPDAAPSS